MTLSLEVISQRLDHLSTVVESDVFECLSRIESRISEAREILKSFDDPCARSALHEASESLNQVYQAHHGFLHQYITMSSNLSERLRNT